MSYECCENKGNKLDIDSDDGEILVTVFSREMGCELVVCLTQEQSEKLKKQVASL
tara:strand:+ start:523 stop:687 length:165 start_codon:yes stop_codon:yes gene_type:complete